MAIQALIPYALAAYGGYRGYRQAKQSGASGIGRLLGAGLGAYSGYSLGTMVPGVQASIGTAGGFVPFTQSKFATSLGMSAPQTVAPLTNVSMEQAGGLSYANQLDAIEKAKKLEAAKTLDNRSMMEKLLYKKNVAEGTGAITAGGIDPVKLSGVIAAGTYLSGAFKPGPVDMYQPTYNINYPEFAARRGPFKYIDPMTGDEKQYEQPYMPESDPSNPYKIEKIRLNQGGLAEIKKFNEGGVNYLPSKVSHDENDSTNYVRAAGYVADGSGAGDKDEDTMLAQLADGEFVTRADGVLGAGIIAGGNPNSFEDMRKKGAEYFYEQQKRYKRVFDLLQEANGQNSKKN